MVRKILVAVDGSACSERAVRFAAELARPAGAELVLVFAAAPRGAPTEPYGVAQRELEALAEESGSRMLEELRTRIAEPGVNLSTRIIRGDPAEELIATADREDADLLVVGSRGRNAAARVLLGSVSDRVVHACKRPVLVVR